MTDTLKVEVPPDFEGFTNEQVIRLCAAFLNRCNEFMLEEMERDCSRSESLSVFEQVYLRAKWSKLVDMSMATYNAMKRYETPSGKLDLIVQKFGDQLGLPAQSLAMDIDQRLAWYKQRIANTFEQDIKKDINAHKITSPVEQIFLMEWRFLGIDQTLGVAIAPQTQLTIGGKPYRIDFIIASPDLKLAIEIDGHDFHEKTKEQAANDRARERSIVREGYTLMRFTGSEIFRNPRSCVNEVAEQIKLLRRGKPIS
jgi:very-short-patch-repair endonuclease